MVLGVEDHPASVMAREDVGRGSADLVLDGVGKYYGSTPVVQSTDLTLHDGEFLTLLGSSGSGKSTTLGMISGFVKPSYGDIRLGSRSIVDVAPRRRNFGIVFQSYALFPQMTAAQNIEFGLRMQKVPRDVRRKRVQDMMQRVDLDAFAKRKPSELSGGQQQRVALARALITRPAALLLDEPLGALDRRLRQQMEVELKTIQRESGVSVLYVTHDQEEAMVMSDRLAVMHNGAIQQIGTPMDVYLQPRTRFVAEFLGEANLLDVKVQTIKGDSALVTYANGQRGVVHAPSALSAPIASGTVCIRPERIRIVADEADVENSLVGTVVETIFLGASFRCFVEVPGSTITVSQTDADGVAVPARGDKVRLGWGPRDAQLLSPEEPTP